MKPTEEQVIAWALDTGCWETDSGELVVDEMNLTRFATLAYEAGRKDERERILDMCKEGWWDGEGIKFHLDKRGEGND